jgi:hypothetical protein
MIGLWILLLLLVMLGFTMLFRAAVGRMGQVVGKATYQRHTSAEEIVSSGRVPASWRGARPGPPYADDARRVYLRRLDDLIRYFGKAPVFDTEETRQLLLGQLRAARERWERGEWQDPSAGSAAVSGPS